MMTDSLMVLMVFGGPFARLARWLFGTPRRSTSPTGPSYPKGQGGFTYGIVRNVIDGDTAVVETFFSRTTVRLDAIDCPEDGQPWGDTARYGLIKLVGGRRVRIEEHAQDEYGRTVATLYVKRDSDGQWINVNARMVTLGHAWVYQQQSRHLPKQRRDELDRLERWARSHGVGLWQHPHPVPPWQWRRDTKGDRIGPS